MGGKRRGKHFYARLSGLGSYVDLSPSFKKNPFKIWGEKVSALDSGFIHSDAISDHSHL